MNTENQYGLKYWASQAIATRKWGHTYVHAEARKRNSWEAHQHDDITFTYCGWGRSLQSNGHKYKVHARRGEKPVSTKELQSLL